MNNLTVLQAISAAIIPLIIAVTWHEVAHAWMGFKFGDYNVKKHLSLNPIPLIDPFGTIVFPIISIILGALVGQPGIIFGWAKPIEINSYSLFYSRYNMTIVILAGPIANLAMALIWALILKISFYIHFSYITMPLTTMAQYGIIINVSIMLLNLLPFLPLDGGRLLLIWLPFKYATIYLKSNKYIMIAVTILILTGVFSYLVDPIFNSIIKLILFLINV